ncbi:MAG: translocation/assembly module TamB domain-containing protein [Pseudomonadota bacterium]
MGPINRFVAPLLLLLAIFAGLAAAAPARAETSIFDVRSQLVEFLLSQISTPGSFEVTVEEVDSPDAEVTRLLGLKVRDGSGVWATADEVALTWNARRLLALELDVPQILVRNLTVTRGPAPGAQPPALREGQADPSASPFDWPRAPIAVILREMRLENVVLEAPVLGHAIAFDATGTAEDQADIQSARLEIVRRDGLAGTIALDYRRRFDDDTLALSLQAREAAGGVVAALAGLPARSASRLSLVGEGPREAWQLRFEAQSDDVFTAEGSATVRYVAPIRISAAFDLQPGPLMSPRSQALLAPRAALTAEISETDGVIAIEALSLAAPALALAADGQFERRDSRFDLTLSLVGGAALADLAEGVAFEEIRFDGSVSGTPDAFTARGETRLAGVASAFVDAETLALTLSAVQQNAATAFTLSGSGAGLRIDRLTPDLLGNVALSAEARLAEGRLAVRSAALRAAPLAATLSGEIAVDAMDGDLAFSARIPTLAPIASAYALALSGATQLDGRLRLDRGLAEVELAGGLQGFRAPLLDLGDVALTARLGQRADGLDLAATLAGTGIRIDRLAPERLGRAELAIDVGLSGDALTIRRATLASAVLQAEIGGRLDGTRDGTRDGTLDLAAVGGSLDYSVDTAALGPLAAAYDVDASGVVSANGTLRLAEGIPTLAGTLGARDLTAAGRRFGVLDLAHDLTFAETIDGTLALRGSEGDLGAIAMETSVRYAAPLLTLEDMSAEALGLALSGALSLQTNSLLTEGALAIAGPLDAVGAFLGQRIAGVIDATFALSHANAQQAATLALDIDGLNTDTLAASRFRIEGGVRDLYGAPRIDLSHRATDALADPASLDSLTVTAVGPLSALDVTLGAEGWVEALPLRLDGAARIDLDGAIGATVSAFALTLDDARIGLESPLTLRETGNALAFEGIDLAVAQTGRIAGDVTLVPNGLFGALSVQALDLALLDRLLGAGIAAGRLDGQASFDTRPGRSAADVKLTTTDLAFDDLAGLATSVDGMLAARWDGRIAEADLALDTGGGTPLTARLALPLRSGQRFPRIPGGEPIRGAIDWAGDVATLWVLLPGSGQELSGPGRIALNLSGTVEDPLLSGEVSIEKGRFEELTAGTILTDLNVTSQIENSRDLVLTLTALDGAEGRVEAQARLALEEGRSRIDATVTAREAVLVRRDDVTARITSELRLAGPVNALSLSGTIAVDRAELRLVSASPATIIDLEPVRIKGDDAPAGGTAPPGQVRLNIAVTAPGLVFARGRGLDSEWRMALDIGGTVRAPRVRGLIETLRGNLSLLGQSFDMIEGEVRFAGGAAINPLLNIVFERTANGITGQVAITGATRDPQIVFSSTPDLPDSEVLPRLIYGSSSQSLSTSQAIQLAAGINTLLTGRRGIIDAARDALGVDLLRVDTTDEGTSLTVGRSLVPGLFVGANRDLEDDGDSAVTVQIDLFEGTKVEAEVGITSSVGLSWSRDF